MNITQTSLKRPVTTLVLFLCLMVIGVIAYRMIPLEFFPELDAPFVSVQIPYVNSTPQEVEQEITRPVEEVLATISGIKRMTSNSSENACNIFMEFEWGTKTDVKAIEAREKIDGIRNQLPADLERVFIQKFNTSDMAILTLRISSERDLSNAYDLLNRNLKRRIERIRGVSRVTMYGIDKKQIYIRLSADKISNHRIDLASLSRTLRSSNFMVTAGRITAGNQRLTVRPLGEIRTVEELGDLIINPSGIRLRDIADVGYEMPELTYGRHLNRKYAIGLDVFKESGANIVEIGDRVKREVEKIRTDSRMKGIDIYFMDDAADGIVSSLNELKKSGLLGALLAVIVLYFFLRHWGMTLIVTLAVPFSLLITLSFMYFMGLSLNILSMLGLLLAIGMLVDNAVVVTENIHRFQAGETREERSIVKAVKEVALAITAGTLTTMIVFLPNIVSSRNEIAIYLKHTSFSFIIALGASLILSQTVVPLLSRRFSSRLMAKSGRSARWVDRIVEQYPKILRWLTAHRRITVLLILLILFSVAVPIMLVKKDMFPEQEDRRLRLFYNINDTYTVRKVEEAVDLVEEYLFSRRDEFEIDSVYTYYEGASASSTILLKKGREARLSQDEIQEKIHAGLPSLAIGRLSFERNRGGTGGAVNELRIQLVGSSTARLTRTSHDLAWALNRIPGIRDARSEAVVGKREIHVRIDRERARMYGLTPREIAENISIALRGANLRRMHDEDGEIDVRVEFHKNDKKTIENLREIMLYPSGKKPIKLASLADFVMRQGPTSIHRENRMTSMGVSMDLQDLTVGEAKKKIDRLLQGFSFPAGVTWNYGRSFDFESEAAISMLINTVLALCLIYIIMASLFESLLFPAAIWTSILFAVVGVWWFFLFTGTTFSLMAWIGVLILIGVVVNNGIVFIDHITHLRAQGLERSEAIVRAGGHRVRPILMTAATTVLSLIPLCLSTAQIGGGPPYFPMARAIVGGLTFSTLVTLFILPEIYLLLDDLRNWGVRLIRNARR